MESISVGSRVYNIGKLEWGIGEVVRIDPEGRTVIKFEKGGERKFATKNVLDKLVPELEFSDLAEHYIEKLPENVQNDVRLRRKFSTISEKYNVVERMAELKSNELELFIDILRRIDCASDKEVDDGDIDWLTEHKVFNLVATIFKRRFKFKKDPWDLVKMCRYLRDAKLEDAAISYFDKYVDEIKNCKALSALYTTVGGSYKDLSKLEQAWECGQVAIRINPDASHPYNLLGSIAYLKGEPLQGDKYFDKALELGSNQNIQFRLIKDTVQSATDEVRDIIASYLMEKDKTRYGWVGIYSNR